MNMNNKKLNTSNLLVIVHGKCEYEIFDYVLQAVEKPKYIYARKQGKQFNSIQITSIMDVISRAPFNNFHDFVDKYRSMEVERKKLKNFKVAIVMDTDDCTSVEKEDFLSKAMFANHWLYEYIWPIHNTINLEDVLDKCKIEYPTSKRRSYSNIFAKRGYTQKQSIQVIIDKLGAYRTKTNMHEVFQYCLDE